MVDDNDDVIKVSKCRRLAKFRQFLATTLVCFLGFSNGIAAGWTSPMGPLLTSADSPIPEKMTMDTIALMGSASYVGSFVCTFFWGNLVDRLGRKMAAILLAIPIITSWVMIIAAKSTLWILIARTIQGVGNTGALITAPVFIAEIAEDDLRGLLGTLLTVALCLGILFSYVVGTYFKYYGLAISATVVPCIFLVTFVWVPETPMYLWSSGEKEKARKSLLWYKGGDTAETERTLDEFKMLPRSQAKPSVKALFASTGTRKALKIGMAMMAAMHLSGVFIILSFAVNIFEMSGSFITPYEGAFVLGTIQIIANVISSILIDRLGRKFLVMFSQIAMTISLAVLGTYLLLFKKQSQDSILRWIPVFSLSMHMFAFSIGLGSLLYLITSEIFPPELRGLAVSKVMLFSCILGFISLNLFPILIGFIELHGLLLSCSFCCIVFTVFFYIYLPETKNIPQNEILMMLNGSGSQDCRPTIRSERDKPRIKETDKAATSLLSEKC